jgi:hypothetical protein
MCRMIQERIFLDMMALGDSFFPKKNLILTGLSTISIMFSF